MKPGRVLPVVLLVVLFSLVRHELLGAGVAQAQPASAYTGGGVAAAGGGDRCYGKACSVLSLSSSSTTIQAASRKVPVVHGAGTAAQAIESGSATTTVGTVVVTFAEAFGANPKCVCSDATNAIVTACGARSISTTGFTLEGSGSATYSWICIGTR